MGEATQGTMKTICSYLIEVELVMVNYCSSVTKGDILLVPDVFFLKSNCRKQIRCRKMIVFTRVRWSVDIKLNFGYIYSWL